MKTTKTMSMAQQEFDRFARDNEAVAKALPAHMMFLMMDEATKAGLVMRADVQHRLNMGATAPLAGLDEFSVARLARKIDGNARILLRDLSPGSAKDGLYICAMFVMALITEGFVKSDQGNMAVLVALMLLEDVKCEFPDENGGKPQWGLDEAKWKRGARALLSRAVLLGFYSR